MAYPEDYVPQRPYIYQGPETGPGGGMGGGAGYGLSVESGGENGIDVGTPDKNTMGGTGGGMGGGAGQVGTHPVGDPNKGGGPVTLPYIGTQPGTGEDNGEGAIPPPPLHRPGDGGEDPGNGRPGEDYITPYNPLTGGWDATGLQQSGYPAGTNPLTGMLQMYQDLYNKNTQGTLNNYNTAANRLRDRLTSMGAGYEDAARNSALSRGGFGLQKGLQQARTATMEQYGQGMVNLSDAYEKNRLQGLQQAFQSAQGYQGEADFARKLAQQQYEYGNTWNLDKAKLAQLDSSQRAQLAMQQYLAQIADQTSRYGIDKGVNSDTIAALRQYLEGAFQQLGNNSRQPTTT